jgi:radical SAM superfamily enzyme YgiQ (UPF0313 family)
VKTGTAQVKRRAARRSGSVAVVKKLAPRRDWHTLVTHGPALQRFPGRPTVGLSNANPFGYGIANLGGNCIAKHLLDHEVNVHFAFADTIDDRRYFLDAATSPSACDVLALSVPFEDTYLNALRMLDRAGLRVRRSERCEDDPLVVVGGMAMINPIPFHDFADVVVVGEGRDTLLEIVGRLLEARRSGADRADVLDAVADLPGVYVPANYRIVVDEDGYVEEFACSRGDGRVEANTVLDMTEFPIFSVWTSAYACYEQGDYFSVMAAMGCHKKCPFCVVGHVQGAQSGRAITMDEDVILELARERRARYGTNLVKIFFSSAFSPDEGDIKSHAIKQLLRRLIAAGFSARVGSLNVRQADGELFELLAAVGQREVTFAPETVEELRARLGKAYIRDDKLEELAALAGAHGFSLNVYSLGGLPGETDDHTRAYARLLARLRRAMGPGGAMFVHYNPAFMKAQTPYQFLGNTRPEEIRRRYALLRAETAELDVDFVSVIDDPMVYYQPVLALGDLDSGRVLEHLYRRKRVSEADWRDAFRRLGLDESRYFTAKDPDRTLPWQHVAYTDQERLRRRARKIVEVAAA